MITQLSKQIFDELNKNFSHQKSTDEAPKVKAAIEAVLKRLNLVTREEFDAQAAVLMRTRGRLEALEARLEQVTSD
jgi:BMFP domain-containing protein YqiC